MATFRWEDEPADRADEERRKPRNQIMMDFENCALREWGRAPPKGPDRYNVSLWAFRMQGVLVDADTTWDEYCSWVRSGHGGEDFQIEEVYNKQSHISVSTKSC